MTTTEFLSAMLVISTGIVSAKDITVSPGDSLVTARDAAKSGDRIILHGGTYRLNEPLVLGPQHSSVTWMAADGEKPVISGGVPVSGWTEGQNGLWKASVNLDNFRQLWVNGQRARRARGQVPAGMKFWGKNEATVITYDNPPGLTGTPGYKPGKLDKIAPAGFTTTDAKVADWKNPGDMEMGFFSSWSHKIAKVEEITKTGEGAMIEMSQPGFFLCNRAGGSVARMPAYMENALELLDEPGEWYFDRAAKTLYYLPRSGEEMGKVEVIAPKLETLVEVKGTRDIRFEGLTFSHATWLQPSTALAYPEVQANCTASADNGFFRPEAEKGWVPVTGEHVKSPANIVVNNSRGIRFGGCTFTALGGMGLDIEKGSQSNVVEGCRFDDIAGNGIQVGDVTREDHHPGTPDRIVKDNHIINNVITRVGQDYASGIGVFAGYTEGTIIAHNEIFNVPYSGISIGWGWGMADADGGRYVDPVKWNTPTTAKNNRIEFNHIHNLMQKLNDGGGVYTLGCQPGTIIRGNHIHDGGKAGLSCGIYLDEGSGGIEVTENLLYRIPRPFLIKNTPLAPNKVHDNFLTPPAALVPGLKGLALKAGSAIDIPHDPQLDPGRFTITAWIRLEKFPSGPDSRRWIVCKAGNEWSDGNISLFVDGRNISGYLNTGGGKPNWHEANGTGEPLPLDKWTPVALTYDGDTLRVYCGGKEVSARKIGKTRAPGNAPLTIGARGDRFSTFDCGDIDDVRLYNRVLTPGEFDKDAAGLVKHWDFETLPGVDAAARIVNEAGLEARFRKLLE